MRKVLILTLLLAFTLSGCKFFRDKFGKNKAADTLAVWEAKQDSLKKAELLKVKKLEEARRAREKAMQDSIARIREMEARNRFISAKAELTRVRLQVDMTRKMETYYRTGSFCTLPGEK